METIKTIHRLREVAFCVGLLTPDNCDYNDFFSIAQAIGTKVSWNTISLVIAGQYEAEEGQLNEFVAPLSPDIVDFWTISAQRYCKTAPQIFAIDSAEFCAEFYVPKTAESHQPN